LIYAVMIAHEVTTNKHTTFLGGWGPVTVVVACLGAAGGLLVASSLKYADSIMKTIATAGAIVISTVLGYFFLDGPMTYIVVLGMLTTVLSIFNYTLDKTPKCLEVQKIV
jgi:solute carrier family 35 (UDP-sugar transporter), member A1/2/3